MLSIKHIPEPGMYMDERARLKALLLEKSYRQGIFTLTSGKTSDFYVDGKQTTQDAEDAYLCGRLLYAFIREHAQPLAAVGGMTLGADPLVTAVSLVSYLERAPIPAFIVRKEAKGHGTGNFIEGKDNLPPGALVALVVASSPRRGPAAEAGTGRSCRSGGRRRRRHVVPWTRRRSARRGPGRHRVVHEDDDRPRGDHQPHRG